MVAVMANWTKHTGTGKPSELADAQIVEISENGSLARLRVNKIWWGAYKGMYRPALDPDGLPYVSAEGLEDWAEYVAVQECSIGGMRVLQFGGKPSRVKPSLIAPESWTYGDNGGRVDAPETHRIPGAPENSLARVWRE